MKMGKIKRLVTFRDFVVFSVAVIVTAGVWSYFKVGWELEWKRNWGKLGEQRRIATEEYISLEFSKSREGTLFQTASATSFVAAVESCMNNQMNNVWYVGTKDGFDCFIHNSDFVTQRFRVQSGKVNANYMMPMTNDVSRWIPVAKVPSQAATDVAEFLNGKQLPHMPFGE